MGFLGTLLYRQTHKSRQWVDGINGGYPSDPLGHGISRGWSQHVWWILSALTSWMYNCIPCVFVCIFFLIYVTYVCWLHSCVQSCWLHPRCIVGSGHLILLLRLVCVVVFACQTLTFSWLKLKSQFLLVVQSSHVHIDFICCGETVDGRNPALVGHYW